MSTPTATGHPMALLKAGVPLSLLADLAGGEPESDRILRLEGGEADWVPVLHPVDAG